MSGALQPIPQDQARDAISKSSENPGEMDPGS